MFKPALSELCNQINTLTSSLLTAAYKGIKLKREREKRSKTRLSWKSTFSYTEMKYCDGKHWIFRDQSSRSSWPTGLVVGGPVRSRGLDSVILTGPFWLEMFCDSRALQLSPSSVPRAYALRPSPEPPGDPVVCSQDVPGSKRNLGMLAEGTQTAKSSCARAGQHQTAEGAQAAEPKDIRPSHTSFR